MDLKFKTDCTYWHKGYERRDYAAGDSVSTDDAEFAAVAVAEGWASSGAAPENKGEVSPAEKPGRKPKAAPENKGA